MANKKGKGGIAIIISMLGKKPKGKMKKAEMAYGGSVGGKQHMYSTGGSVADNLPNKGLRKLAQTPKGRDAVQNMGFNV